MLTIPVKCFSCGGVFQRKLKGITSIEDLNSVESTCFDCHKALNNTHAAEYSKRLGLTPLRGSEKQIVWANPIRLKIASELLTRLIDEFETKSQYNQAKERLVKTLNKPEFSLAAYWINNRWNNYGIKQRLLKVSIQKEEVMPEIPVKEEFSVSDPNNLKGLWNTLFRRFSN